MKKIILILVLIGLLSGCGNENIELSNKFTAQKEKTHDIFYLSNLTSFKGASVIKQEINKNNFTTYNPRNIDKYNYGFIIHLKNNSKSLSIVPECWMKQSTLFKINSTITPNIFMNLKNKNPTALFYLKNKEKEIKAMINGPSKISSYESKMKGHPVYLNPKNGSYKTSFGFNTLGRFQEITCKIKVIVDKDKSTSKSFTIIKK
ncbi:MAG: hypothetical protein ACQESF_06870 [Nanobdellota archaeon]